MICGDNAIITDRYTEDQEQCLTLRQQPITPEQPSIDVFDLEGIHILFDEGDLNFAFK